MLNKSDLKYILKKVIIYVSIALIIMSIGSCKAKAFELVPQEALMFIYNQDDHQGGSSQLHNYNPTSNSYTITINNDENNTFNAYKVFNYNNNLRINMLYVYYNFDDVNGSKILEYKFALNNVVGDNNKQALYATQFQIEQENNQYKQCSIYNVEPGSIGNDQKKVYTIKCVIDRRPNNINVGFGTNGQRYTNYDFYIGDIKVRNPVDDQEIENTLIDINERQDWLINGSHNGSVDDNNINSKYGVIGSRLSLNNSVITSLITLPIQFLQAFYIGWNGTCSTYDMGTIFGKHIYLPCIDLYSFLGVPLVTMIDVLMSGFLILSISKKFVNVFDDLTNFRSNQINELYGGGS